MKTGQMGNNNIQEFYNRLATDQSFAEELKKFMGSRTFATPDDEVAALLDFAKLQGYDITLDNLK